MKTRDEVIALFQNKYEYLKAVYPSVGPFDEAGIYQNPDGGWQLNLSPSAAITLRPCDDEPHETHGGICERWRSLGGAFNVQMPGRLGYPVSDEDSYPLLGSANDRISRFQNGYITWDSINNATEVHYYQRSLQVTKPNASIFITRADLDNQDSSTRFAAKELRYYLARMTAQNLEIQAAENAVPGASGFYLGMASNLDVAHLGTDGFRIESGNYAVRIGGGVRGILYGVYEYLERLGCRFFTHNCEFVPTIAWEPDIMLRIPGGAIEEKPVFEYRAHNYADVMQNPRFSARCRFNGCQKANSIPKRLGGGLSYAMFVHTFEPLLPTATYGASHPEYYALVNGKRVTTGGGRTQLCLTNPDVLRIVTDNARSVLRQHPGAQILSLSQNDWWGNCQCANCSRIDAEEGSPSGTLLRFVNAIAEALEPEFPNVIFDTLAYCYTRPAPRITRNRHNVCVRLCSIECCFSHPMETCDDKTRSVRRPDGSISDFKTDLAEWGRICDRMYIWDYTTCFAHYPTPHPNWRVLQPNLQLFARNNVKGVFEQACGASRGGVDFNELRLYLLSKLLWNPDCDLDRHRREFMAYFYGAAAPMLNAYLDLVCDAVERDNVHVGFNDHPVHSFLDETMLDRYDALFDQAAKAVAGDPLRLWRVEKNRLSIRWVRLKRAAMLRNEYNAEEINRFFADWRAFNLSRIDEWCNIETTHRALLDGRWRGTDYFEHWTMEEPEFL